MKSKFRLVITILCVLIPCAPELTFGLPDVPGYIVEAYASVPVPHTLSFDNQTGVLYVGNGASQPASVHRISHDGQTVSPYGDPFSDLDAVIYDPYGHNWSGEWFGPGTVIAGGGPDLPGHIIAIRTDQSTEIIFESVDFENPTDMAFNSTGRLLFVDWDARGVFQTSGENPTMLFPTPARPYNIAVHPHDDRIFVSTEEGTIRIYGSDGTLLDDNFATGLPTYLNGIPLAFGPGGVWGTDLYVIGNNLRRYDACGNYTIVGTGYGTNHVDMTFGPDGSLYVSGNISVGEGIIRITPDLCALSGRIAFVSPHPDEGGRLWIMDASAGLSSKTEVPLPADLVHIGCPEWSQDGSMITFHAVKSGETKAGIYVVKPDGSGFCKVSPDGMDIGHPSFSPDGSQIVGCTSNYILYIFTKVGECEWQITYLARGVHPKWSPDGNKIAYSNWGLTYDSDVFAYHLDTGYSILITPHNPGKAFNHAIWSPDGTKLALVELDRSTNKNDLWIVNADGSDRMNLTDDWGASDELWPTWSADGQHIVFSSDRAGNWDLWYTPVESFAPVNISRSPEDEVMPAMTFAEPEAPCMVFIPCGEFEMGDHFDSGYFPELPVHEVYVDSFCIGRYEITNRQYCDFLNAADVKVVGGVVYAFSDSSNSYPYCDTHGSSFYSQIYYSGGVFNVRTKDGRGMSDDPMVQVSWYGSVAYCNWLSQEEGYQACYDTSTWECDFSKNGYRLPTEAEWEFAARGGLAANLFPWGNTISHSQANYFSSSSYSYDVSPTSGYHPTYSTGDEPHTSPVGSFTANGYGLYDMAGNVWEWCNDWWDADYYQYCKDLYGDQPCPNPTGGGPSIWGITRGGSWWNSAWYARVAHRGGPIPDKRSKTEGFRVVRTSEPAWPVAYWSFDDASDPGHDDSGNGHDGTVDGAEPTNGICQGAMSFDDYQDIIRIPNEVLDGKIDFTFSAWVYLDLENGTFGDFLTILSGAESSVNHNEVVFAVVLHQPFPNMVMYTNIHSYGNAPLSDVEDIAADTWQHMTWVRHSDTGTVEFYIDGKSQFIESREEWSGAISIPNPDALWLGHDQDWPNGGYQTPDQFYGKMDEVRIYDRALSECEIRELATACEQPECWQEQDKLVASDSAEWDMFGHGASISGNYAIIGDGEDIDGLENAGAAYIFKREGENWIQQAKLTASDIQAHAHFGALVSISGNYAIAGAYDEDFDGLTNAGAAYIFKRDGESWSQQAKLTASDAQAGDMFGTVSISGDYAVVGATHANRNEPDSGSVYVFKRDGEIWTQQAKLNASDGEASDSFGCFVSISGDYLIIGSSLDDHSGTDSGSAYIFKRDGENWLEQAKLTASDSAGNDHFGRCVSISGDYAIVGAVWDDDNGSNSGSAYVFKRDGECWIEQGKLIASDGASGDYFGTSVSISSTYAVIGAHYDDEQGTNSGSAYIFRCEGQNWIEYKKLIASDSQAEDRFGCTVVINGQYAIIGALFDDDNGSNSGSAYIFENVCNTEPLADAGDDQEVSTGPDGEVEVVLDCSGSSDPDGDELTYTWLLDGEEIATGVNPTIVLPCGVYIIELIVNDGTTDSEPDYVQITVLDGTAPVISCPGNVTLECPADTNPANTGTATATDNCDDEPAITYGDVLSGSCPEVIARTWTATDSSDNSSSCTQTITVQDTTPPVISCPDDVTLECPADTTPGATGEATATDACGDVTVTYSDTSVSGCGNTKVITRTWTATDECGHISTCVQTITVVDTTEPEVTIVIPQADAALQDGVTLTAEASDTCGDVTEVYFYIREPGGASGIPIGQEDLSGELNTVTGQWVYGFDTTLLMDGYYVILAKAVDSCGNEGWSEVLVEFSIRNWAVIELLPASENNKAGRTMPVKFALRIAKSVDPEMPFVYNEQLEIRIYDAAEPGTILQTSVFGDGAKEYRIESIEELYITNFKTKKDPAQYIVEIWRPSKNFMVGSFGFETVK